MAAAESKSSNGPGARFRQALGAWQPFTGRGVAAFGTASFGRTLSFQLLFALLAAVAVIWSLRHAWFPPLTATLERLPPAAAEIRHGRLFWPDTNAVTLAENPQLAVAVDPSSSGDLGRSADLQIEFRPTGVRLEGIFGHQLLPYPPDLIVPLDQVGGVAAWGAWNWVGLVLVGALVFSALLALWWLSATGLTLPVWLAALIFRRALTWGGAWRLAAAAWLPATLVLLAGVLLYATNGVRLTGLAVLAGCHVPAALLWLGWGILKLPDRVTVPPPSNPFDSAPQSSPGTPKSGRIKNPFHRGPK